MSIKIDKNKCVGCSCCVEVCPGNLIKIDGEKKAFIKHERDCWGCTSGAVSFFLGADIGGRGAMLAVETKGAVRFWRVTKIDGSVQEIIVNSSDANKY